MSKEKRDLLTTVDMIGGLADEKWLKFLGKDLLIQRITLGLLAKLSKFAGDDPYQVMIHIIYNGCKKPQFKLAEIKRWDPLKAAELAREITDLSGFTEEEIEKATNLSKQEKDGQSGD